MQHKFGFLYKLQKLLTILLMVFYSGGIIDLFFGASDSTAADTSAAQTGAAALISWGLVYFISILFFVTTKKWFSVFKVNYLLTVLLIFTFLSIFWSDYPDICARYLAGLFFTTIFGYYLAVKYDLYEVLKMIRLALILAAFLSLAVVVALPKYGIMHDNVTPELNGNWRGIYIHKNPLGRMMAIGMLVNVILWMSEKKSKYIYSSVLFLVLIVFSKSTSAIINIFVIGVLIFIFNYLKVRSKAFNITIAAVMLFVAVFLESIVNLYASILGMLGKDVTLTGRTTLWKLLIEMGMKRPIIGYGFGSFWIGDKGPSGFVWKAVGWQPPHAHNGYIDLFLTSGIVGLVLYLIIFLRKYFSYLVQYADKKNIFYMWGYFFLVLIFTYNLDESNILKHNNLFWVLLVFTLTYYSLNPERKSVLASSFTKGLQNLAS